ncbi:hypothetical protein Tcan_08271, partial [Toxocara canis]
EVYAKIFAEVKSEDHHKKRFRVEDFLSFFACRRFNTRGSPIVLPIYCQSENRAKKRAKAVMRSKRIFSSGSLDYDFEPKGKRLLILPMRYQLHACYLSGWRESNSMDDHDPQ